MPAPWHGGKDSPARVVAIVAGYGRDMPFKRAEGIAFDRARQEVYVADGGNHQIAVFDLQGMRQRVFPHWVEKTDAQGKPVLQPGDPKAVAVNSRGEIFVVDSAADYLDILDYRGRSIAKLRAEDLLEAEDRGRFKGPLLPVEVAVDAQDQIYVALSGRNQVVVLGADRKPIRRIGRSGKEKGGFTSITGVAVDKEGRVFVTDASATPVQVFSPQGELLLSFGAHETGWQNFSLPVAAIPDGEGNIWVADAVRQVVSKFDAKGDFVSAIGGFGIRPGELRYPSALAGDGDKYLFVLEKVGGRYQVLEFAASESAAKSEQVSARPSVY